MKKGLMLFVVVALLAVFMPAMAHADAGYDKGFFIKNEDDTFKLTFNGRVQPRLFYEQQKGTPKQLSFHVRRASLSLTANYHEVVTAGFTLLHTMTRATSKGGLASTNPFATVNIAGAIVAVEIIPEFTVTAGMVGLPLDMIGDTAPGWLLLPEPPITATQIDGLQNVTTLRSDLGAPSGLGINFSGGYWKWYYSASVVNGAEDNYVINPDRKMSFGFKTGFNILDPVPGKQTDFDCSETPKLTINAGSIYQGKRNDPNTTAEVKYLWTSTLGVALRWAGFSFTSEGYYRKTRFNTIGRAAWARPRLTDIGYYGAAGYYAIPKKLEIAAQAGQIFRQGPDNNSWQMGGGLNYYIFENNLKLQLAYTLTVDFDDVAGTESNKIHDIILVATASF